MELCLANVTRKKEEERNCEEVRSNVEIQFNGVSLQNLNCLSFSQAGATKT